MAMNNEVERLVLLRRRVLWSAVIGYPMFLGAEVADTQLPPEGSHLWIRLLGLAGLALSAYVLWRVVWFVQKFRANPMLARAVCDELWLLNRYKAAFFAFSVFLPIQGLFIGLFTRTPNLMPPAAYACLNLVVVWVAFFGGFLYLDQKE